MNAIRVALVAIAFGLPTSVALAMWFRAKYETRKADEEFKKLMG